MPVDPCASSISLHMAAMNSDIPVIKSLLRKRTPATNIDVRDILGDSPLLKAARYGHIEVVRALLEAGADATVQDNKGWNCMHVSITNNHGKVFSVVLAVVSMSNLPHIEETTLTGDTALHMAAYHDRKWAVRELLRLGANPNALNSEGQRPFQVARQDEVRSILLPSACNEEQNLSVQGGDHTRDHSEGRAITFHNDSNAKVGGEGRCWDSSGRREPCHPSNERRLGIDSEGIEMMIYDEGENGQPIGNGLGCDLGPGIYEEEDSVFEEGLSDSDHDSINGNMNIHNDIR